MSSEERRSAIHSPASESEFDHTLNPVAVNPVKVFRGEGSGVVVCLAGDFVFFRRAELGAWKFVVETYGEFAEIAD